MPKPSFWNGEKIAILKRLWELELPVAEIAETIGCSKVSVCSKAADLFLGLHPDSRERRPYRTKGAAIMDRLPDGEDAGREEAPAVRLPRLKFLERRLQGEGTSW